jgi:hypothetical protein
MLLALSAQGGMAAATPLVRMLDQSALRTFDPSEGVEPHADPRSWITRAFDQFARRDRPLHRSGERNLRV